jgi:hypothetical protein
MRKEPLRQELTEHEATNERNCDARDGDAQRRLADRSHKLEVGLHPSQQQQQENAVLRDAVEHGFLLGRPRKDCALQVRPQHAQHRRSEHDAAEQHAHHGRLTDAIHDLAQEATDRHQHDELGEKDDLRRAALAGLGRE